LVSFVASGATCRAAAERFGVGVAVLQARGNDVQKSLHAVEQDRPDVARKRERWKRHQHRLDPRRLVFIDETWAKTNMTRTHGRSLLGEPLLAKVPQGRWRSLTFIAALRHDRITTPDRAGPADQRRNVQSLC
jgi:hypothetical protein